LTILYLETNFLISVAMGREPEAGEMLARPLGDVRIALPQICCMESLSALYEEKRHRKGMSRTFDEQINQLKRDLTSIHAKALESLLEQSIDENERLIAEISTRLFDAMDRIAEVGELIALSPAALLRSRQEVLIQDLTDNLILHCVLEHARANAAEARVFLSGNRKDFGTQSVRDALTGAGVSKYLAEVKQFVGWYRSHPAP
jgi:hypothetical protein